MPEDDACIIVTSGTTSPPKGVAVTHGDAAAFADAEPSLVPPDDPPGPADRMLAGLPVAFDAAYKDMWLAWRHGACLVQPHRSAVRTALSASLTSAAASLWACPAQDPAGPRQ